MLKEYGKKAFNKYKKEILSRTCGFYERFLRNQGHGPSSNHARGLSYSDWKSNQEGRRTK